MRVVLLHKLRKENTIHITKAGKTSKLSNRSNALTSEMLAALKSLSKGDEFEFSNTKAYLPNGKDVVDVHAKSLWWFDLIVLPLLTDYQCHGGSTGG